MLSSDQENGTFFLETEFEEPGTYSVLLDVEGLVLDFNVTVQPFAQRGKSTSSQTTRATSAMWATIAAVLALLVVVVAVAFYHRKRHAQEANKAFDFQVGGTLTFRIRF